MGYHIISNDGTYNHWVRDLSYSGEYDSSTHFYITGHDDTEIKRQFSTYDPTTETIVLDQELLDEVAEVDVRKERDKRLAETDWMTSSDRTMSQAEIDYRQALRDITDDEGFPHNVTWPTNP